MRYPRVPCISNIYSVTTLIIGLTGYTVMLLRNVCTLDGLCNGARLVVIKLYKTIFYCEILTGDKKCNVYRIAHILFDTTIEVQISKNA